MPWTTTYWRNSNRRCTKGKTSKEKDAKNEVNKERIVQIHDQDHIIIDQQERLLKPARENDTQLLFNKFNN